MAAATAPSDLIVKFDASTDTTTTFTLGSTALTSGENGISFNLQIIEKGQDALATGSVGSTVVGSGTTEINTLTSKELAYVIARYFADKGVLIPGNAAGVGRNIRSMKLIVNVDPTA